MPDSDRDLFAPSIDPSSATALAGEKPPWRLRSLAYACFFGGPLAAGVLGWLQAKRLGAPRAGRTALIAGVAIALAVAVGVVAWAGSGGAEPMTRLSRDTMRTVRLLIRGAGLLAYLIFRPALRAPDRLYQMNVPSGGDAEYSSLWVPGLIGMLVGGSAMGGLIVGLAAIW